MSGPLAGLRVIELGHERADWAGKLMADAGADVVRVEPPGGCQTRRYAPFLGDKPGPERSLYFWHYNTSKRGVTLDLEQEQGRDLFRQLSATADVVLEGEDPGRMAVLALDYDDLRRANSRLIVVSITPFGRSGPRAHEAATDLTLFGGGGPAWMNGYDDHTLPPVRGGGGQAYHTGGHFAVMSALVALLERDVSGEGQHIDVNLHAAANVTTEAGSYTWLVSRETTQRQTGRHAAVNPSMDTQLQCKDGRWVNSGVPPRTPGQFGRMLKWLDDLGLLADFALAPLLEAGAAKEWIDLSLLGSDAEMQAIFGAGRDALTFIAANSDAYEFFSAGQQRGFQVGIIYSPEEVLSDPQMVARGFPVTVEHPEMGASYTYAGVPHQFSKSPARLRRRAPLLGEHNAEVYGALGIGAEELARLRAAGVV